MLTKNWILEHFADEDLWIAEYTNKAMHLQEVHYNLEQYIKLKSIKQDLSTEKTYNYVCNCFLYSHEVPETIHQELTSKENVLKCEKCNQILVHLDGFDLDQNYKQLNHVFEKTIENHNSIMGRE